MKSKLTLPILYLIMMYELYIEVFISISVQTEILNVDSLLKIMRLTMIIRPIVWAVTVEHALRNKNDEEFLKKALSITKFGLIPFFIINFVFAVFMGAFITIGTLGAGAIIYIPLAMILTWSIILPGTIYGISLNRIKFNQNIISKNTETKLNILQFIFVLDVFSSMVTLFKYKNKANN